MTEEIKCTLNISNGKWSFKKCVDDVSKVTCLKIKTQDRELNINTIDVMFINRPSTFNNITKCRIVGNHATPTQVRFEPMYIWPLLKEIQLKNVKLTQSLGEIDEMLVQCKNNVSIITLPNKK